MLKEKSATVPAALPLQLTFLLFAMLLNSVGVIIIQLSDSTHDFKNLGFLDAFKDLPIAIISALSVTYISKFSFKKALIAALVLSAAGCFVLPLVDDLWVIRIWLSLIGISFAIAKISVFSILKFITKQEKVFTRIMSRIEAFFMLGVFLVNIGFGLLLDSSLAGYWKFGFWLTGFLALYIIFLLLPLPIKEEQQHPAGGKVTFSQLFSKKNLVIYCLIFLLVYTEQSFNSWMPAFYKNNLGTNSFFSLQSAAFFALFSFAGRSITARIIHRFNWSRYILVCLVVILFLLALSQVLMFKDGTLLLFILPLIGLFTAPLYPLLNSHYLSRLTDQQVGSGVAVVVIFSSLGSSIGSFIMSRVFVGKMTEYYPLFIFLPAAFMLLIFVGFFYLSKRDNKCLND